MKYFKKYPIFFVVISALLVAFVGLLAYDVVLISQKGKSTKLLDNAMRRYRSALADDPTQKAIDASNSNIAKLEGHLEFLEKDLTRASTDIFKPLTAKEGYQLVEQLRGFVNGWRKEAQKLDIRIGNDMDFGFKKYVAPNAEPPKDSAIADLWKQACVLNYINKKLFACKTEKSPMGIFAVQREILESEGVKEQKNKRGARARRVAESNSGDNFKIDEAITARKKGSLDTLAYKFVFAGHTDVLRRFLNQLKDFDAMLVVRSIDVKPADMTKWESIAPASAEFVAEQTGTTSTQSDGLSSLFNDNSGNTQQQSEQSSQADASAQQETKTPVVTDNISEFTVVIEYVEVVKKPNVKKEGDKE
jgi:hypothetical protein